MSAQPGAEAPVSLIATHGFGDSSEVWPPLLTALSGLLRAPVQARTWDLPGHGTRRTDRPGRHDIGTVTEELRLRAARSPWPPVLLGHSLGGYLSLRCALTAGTPARAIVLVSTGPGFRNPSARSAWNATMDRLAGVLELPPGAAAIAYMTDSLVLDRLPDGPVPALVVRGASDRPEYQAGGAVIAARWPGARLVDIPDAGHEPHRTHPAEVASAIARFLEPDRS